MLIEPGGCHWPVAATIPASTTTTTIVRIKVARSELMFSTPIFAKIAVSAAKTADNTAQNCQEIVADFTYPSSSAPVCGIIAFWLVLPPLIGDWTMLHGK